MARGLTGAFVGMKHTGKTTMMQDICRPLKKIGVPIEAYDPQGDWTDEPLPELDEFVERTKKGRDQVFIYEEASAFFKGQLSKDFRLAIARTRKPNVTIFLSFHGFHFTPDDLIFLVDYLYIFKTLDYLEEVENRVGRIPGAVEAWQEVMNSRNPYENRCIKIGLNV